LIFFIVVKIAVDSSVLETELNTVILHLLLVSYLFTTQRLFVDFYGFNYISKIINECIAILKALMTSVF